MFVVASILTLILGHIASGYHRAAVEWSHEPKSMRRDSEAELGRAEKRRLCELFPHDRYATGLAVCLVLTSLIIIMGANVVSFQMVESGALATLLLEDHETVKQYSLMSLGTSMTEGKAGNVGLHLVEFIFFVFSLYIPVALQVCLLILCFAPMAHTRQLLMFDIARALDAWAAFDVFAMAVTISHFEFGLFSTFLMHFNNLAQGCNLVVEYLHEECFHLECSLTPGYFVMFLGALLSYVVPKLSFSICQRALDQRSGKEMSDLDGYDMSGSASEDELDAEE